jgi:cobyrinic acid a,c-diamide synthase
MTHTGILLAAPNSGSGKTTVTCALLEALKRQNIRVRSFKSGPDYIDPMFHERVIGVPSRNLDTFFSEQKQVRELYALGQDAFEMSVIEGAMGLYDGLGGTREEGSAYHLAQTLDLPIVLVLDAHGMGRTMVALLAGLLQYDTDHRIVGVILNRTTEHFCAVMSPLIEEELGLIVFGFFPNMPELHLESRHLGLKLPEEVEHLQEQVRRAADALETCVDIEGIARTAQSWALLHDFRDTTMCNEEQENKDSESMEVHGPKIAVARDAAFCFYYKDNLRMLQEAGAQLLYFSPLSDKKLPDEADAILLGGGYPELCAKQLSENVSMRESIRAAIAAGMPSVAECGGFMYLHETLTDEAGQTYPMVGVVPGGCRNTGKLVRFGYVEVKEKTEHFLGNSAIRGHEFHYYNSDQNGTDCVAVKPTTGRTWDCVHSGSGYWWGYPHLYYPSNPAFVENFVAQAEYWRE